MKYATLALIGIGLAIGSSIAQGQAPAPKGEPELKTVEQKFAYAIGLNIGQSDEAAGRRPRRRHSSPRGSRTAWPTRRSSPTSRSRRSSWPSARS